MRKQNAGKDVEWLEHSCSVDGSTEQSKDVKLCRLFSFGKTISINFL